MFGRPSHRARIRTQRLLIILLCAAAAGIVIFLFATGHFPTLVFGNGSVRSLSRVLPDNIQEGADGFLYSEGSQLICLNRSGSEAWSLNVGLSDIVTRASDELILNYSGPNLQVMRYSKEQLFATSVDSEILDGAAGSEYVAVSIDAPAGDATVQQMIYVFGADGQKSTQLSLDREVIDFGFFSDDTQTDILWVASLDTSGAAPISYVTIYNKTNGEVSFSVSMSDRVVEKAYVTSNLIFVSGSGIMTAYTYHGELQSEVAVHGWKPEEAAVQPLSLRVLYVPRADAVHTESVLVYQADEGSSASSFADYHFVLPMGVLDTAITPTNVFAFTENTMYVYSLDGGLQRVQELGADIASVKQVSNSYVILWGTRNNTYIMRLQ
ncbi:MAG: hypothetical protein HDQ87_11615 [Clostridia bacterium]|nr:hypothetical protein [Clostridia bacterium]